MKRVINQETVFAFFLLSGVFKDVLSFLPIDLTILALVLSVGLAFFNKYQINRSMLVPIGLFILLAALLLISYYYSDSEVNAIVKSMRFLVITGWAFCGVFFIVKTEESLLKLFTAFIILAAVMSVVAIYNWNKLSGQYGFVSVWGASYIALGRIASLGALLMLCLQMFKKNKRIVKFMTIIAGGLMVFASMVSGGRMPIISLVIVFVLIVFPTSLKYGEDRKKRMKNRIRNILLLILIAFIIKPLWMSDSLMTTRYRMELLFTDGGGKSVEGRTDRVSVAYQMWADSPVFGNGVGSFGVHFTGNDINDYPHNIFYELLSEQGLVGLAVFMAILLYALRSYITARRKLNWEFNRFHLTIFVFFAYFSLNAFVAGDLNDNRLLFTSLGLLSITPFLNKENDRIAIRNKEVTIETSTSHPIQLPPTHA